MQNQAEPPSIRLAELVALLSLGTDLGFGQPMEHVIRQCLIALRIADLLELSESERVVLYYSGLLAWVACHTDSYEQAKWFGDDIATRADLGWNHDSGKRGSGATLMLKYMGGAGRPVHERVRVGARFLLQGHKDVEQIPENHYRAADALAARLGLGEDARVSLRESYERWDGKGPLGLRGADATLASRIVNLADVVEVFHRIGGVDAAITVARERSGGQFDPELVRLFCDQAADIFGRLGPDAGWEDVIVEEPGLRRSVTGPRFDDALEAIAGFTDLKSPWTIGHSHAVAELAAGGARELGFGVAEAEQIRRAGLLHDIGRLGVSNRVWDKRGPLGPSEMERVRLHPYLSERMLAFSRVLAPLGAIAVQHHERLDGSGYPHNLRGNAISPAGRVLAAADCYRTMIEMRPHRDAKTPAEAARELRQEATRGRLDGDAVEGVLRVAGHATDGRREWPAGLTTREVEVLRLLVRGLPNREIADRLVISKKTVGNHIEHIYGKIGASNRALASLFAVEHGLIS